MLVAWQDSDILLTLSVTKTEWLTGQLPPCVCLCVCVFFSATIPYCSVFIHLSDNNCPASSTFSSLQFNQKLTWVMAATYFNL